MNNLLIMLLLLLPLLPAGAQAADKKPHSATLTWSAPAKGSAKDTVVAYNVYRAEKENGDYALIAKKITVLTYTDTNVKSKHSYYYKVTSVDARGQESIASTVTATIP